MADPALVRRLLLGLIGPDPDRPGLAGLDARGWEQIARMAAEHRLGPLLHAQWRDGGLVPAGILDQWRDAHRRAALHALAQRADLLAATGLLRDAGIDAVALKGAWLAWHAWPAPALRPARDIDLLLPAERVREGWEVLHRAGFGAPDGHPADGTGPPPAKHLAALLGPQGTFIELHLRCWEQGRPGGRAMPPGIDRAILEGAVAEPGEAGLRYPAPADMFTHLAIHAAGTHLLDCGPLVLADVDYLLRARAIDWSGYWIEARSGGWARCAALVLALADRWRRPGILAESHCPVAVPDDLLAQAPDLLLQPLAHRSGTQVLAGLGNPVAGLRARLARGRIAALPGWLFERLAGAARGLADPDTRARARSAAGLSAWLDR